MNRSLKYLIPISTGMLIAGTLCPLSVQAQQKEAPKTASYIFPKLVMLALRGRAGDSFQFKSINKSSTKMNVETQGEVLNSDDSNERTYRYALLEKLPNGNFKLEVKLLGGIESNNAEDGIRRKSAIPGTMIAFLKPNNEQEKLEFPSQQKTEPKSGKPVKLPELDAIQKKELAGLLESLNFPEKPLGIGDSWTFHPNRSPFDDSEAFTPSEVTGKLVSFEMFGKTPCAKIEAFIQPKGVAEEFERNIKKNLPPDATLKGTTTMAAKAVYFVSLDRGIVLDIQGKSSFKLNYVVHADGKDLKLTGNIELENHDTTTSVPDFDPALIPVLK